jgi:hypothetical protein
MRSRQRCCLVLALLLVPSLMPVGTVRAKETVALTFGWPSGLNATMCFSARTTRRGNGQSDSLDMAGRYNFTTSAVGDGLMIQFDDIGTEVENAGSGPQAMINAYMAKAVSTPPSYVVSPRW